jgi:three-Cys-motif partner protein
VPPTEHGTIWPADPHTLAKIEILKGYLNAYFQILGRTKRGQPILFVDGLAGPGEYTNASDGSPVVALNTATSAINSLGRDWIAGDVHCVFIEPDSERCENLRERIKKVRVHPRVRSQVMEKTFVDGISELRRTMPRPFTTGEPLFVFIDPFGATGVPFAIVSSILSTQCSEVLINLDSDGIARNLPSPKLKDTAQRELLMTSVFGDDSWREAISSTNFKSQCQQVLELYKKKLRSIPAVEYVFSFEMRGRGDTLNYHLVFASQNPLGLKKMKEAMRSIDKTGSYSFWDDHIGQATLFSFDNPGAFAPRLHKQFVGKEVPYAEIAKLTLNETPFIVPGQMLKFLKDRGQIDVTWIDPKRTRGFSEEHVRAVKFLDKLPVEKPRQTSEKQGELFGGN